MRIVIITSQFPPLPGGGGTYSFYLATALAEHCSSGKKPSCQVKVITNTSMEGSATVEKRKINLEIHKGPFARVGRVPYEATISYALRLCRSFRPHVIHGQHFDGAYVASQLKVALPGVSTFATFHKSPTGLQVAEQRFVDPQMIAVQSVMPWIDRLVATCTIYRKEFLAIGISAERIALVWPGLSCARLVTTACGTKNRARNQLRGLGLERSKYDCIVLCPARVDPSKDIETFVRAAGDVKRRFTDQKRIAFLVAGQSPNPNSQEICYQQTLKMMAVQEQVDSDLFFGSFGLAEMLGIYKLCDACVLPSVREALGLVLLESLALRAPVVVANVPGVSDIISSEVNGLVFPSRDHRVLADQIERLLIDQPLRESLIQMGVKTVQSRFSESRMADDHLRVYSAGGD